MVGEDRIWGAVEGIPYSLFMFVDTYTMLLKWVCGQLTETRKKFNVIRSEVKGYNVST